jgi:prepilin-type N-terminal cleavage/methylation domain-containing protein
MYRQRGFNLVELAIVLVIIGLLLGGVLKGQALVTNAKIKRASNDFNGVTAAVYTYLDRYGALPGDDNKAATRWPAATPIVAATSGNGDGVLEGVWNAKLTDTDKETYYLWQHLFRANLVGSEALPANAFGGIIGIQEGPHVSAGGANADTGLNGILICMNNISGDIAEILDINFDDGTANTGLLRAIEDGAITLATAYLANKNYVICKRI